MKRFDQHEKVNYSPEKIRFLLEIDSLRAPLTFGKSCDTRYAPETVQLEQIGRRGLYDTECTKKSGVCVRPTKLKVGQNLNEKWFSSISRLFVALGTGLDYEQEVNFHLVIFKNKYNNWFY